MLSRYSSLGSISVVRGPTTELGVAGLSVFTKAPIAPDGAPSLLQTIS